MAQTEIQARTELGAVLEDERERRELSKQAWAEELGISKPTYLNWLSRSVDIEFPNIRRIAEVMGMSTLDIFALIEASRAKGVYRESIAA